MKDICTEIEIKAPAEHVWKVLTDFASYPEWNPFIRRISGEARVGGKLTVRFEPSGSKGFTLKPVVLKIEPNHEFRWRGRFFIPGLFEGEHAFLLEPLTPSRTRLVHRETFTGLLIPRLDYILERDIKRGFEEMNRALKTRVERSQAK